MTFVLMLGWDWLTGSISKNQGKRAIHLRETITKLGATCIKLGQILSCRPDLIPPIYLNAITDLQDKIPSFPDKIAYQLIEEDLGSYYSEIYAELSPSPVAAASLGQVYQGRLKTGEVVAVKVQRPGLLESISLDIYILRQLAGLIQNNISFIHSNLIAIIDELGTRLFEETDYLNEAENAEKFANLYGNIHNIKVPKIYRKYTSRRVLTMEWIFGIKLTEVETLKSLGLDPDYFITLGLECALQQLLGEGFFHADPHPGNLLATAEGELAFIDFGMMSSLEVSYRYRFIESMIHILMGDFEGLAEDYIKMGFLPPETNLKPLIPDLEDIFGSALGASVTELGFNRIINKLSPLLYKYPFQLPTYYLLIFRSGASLEGIALKVKPDLQVFAQAYPYVASRLLTATVPELKTCLQDILIKDNRINWQRLEQLIQYASRNKNSQLKTLINPLLSFIESESGSVFRQLLIRDLLADLDTLPSQLLTKIIQGIAGNAGIYISAQPPRTPTLDFIQRVGKLLVANSVNPLEFVPDIVQLLLKPEAQRLGQKVIEEWGWKMLKGFSLELFVKNY